MERAATTAFFNAVIGRLVGEILRQVKMYKDLSIDAEDMKRGLIMLAASMDSELIENGGIPRTTVERAYGKEMRSLTHDIEDCLERFLHRVLCKEGASLLDRVAHTLKNVPRSMRFARKIKKLKKRLQNARDRVFNPSQKSSIPTLQQAFTTDDATDCPIGIAQATESLEALLEDPEQRSTIAIVGFGGSGKSTLAREVYRSCKSKKTFSCFAWVSLSSIEDQSALGILSLVQKQFLPGEEFSLSTLRKHLSEQTRYLIVLDGAKMEHVPQWDTLRNSFEGRGAVLVTTRVRSVATAFTSHGSQEKSVTPDKQADKARHFGYVYNMRPLSKEDSQALALLGSCAPELLGGSITLLEQCDGHPLALASVANQLRCQDEPTGQFCKELSSCLGSYLEWGGSDEQNFAMLRDVLFDIYAGLPDHFARTCMLYLCIFPVNHPIRRSVIIRRWCAEGYAQSDRGGDLKVGDDVFRLLLDRSAIWPVAPSRNSKVKAYRIHGILHAFLLHKSASENFVTVFDMESNGLVRHLVVNHSKSMNLRTTRKLDLARTRSVTISGNGGTAISNFLEYKLIRVLDLEECSDINDEHVGQICKMWNLRYLSLGPNVTIIPKEIADLKLLETLDISKTKVSKLPLDVIRLPCLLHLIGKFALQKALNTTDSSGQPIKECNLETLTGIVADGTPGFLQFVVSMTRLKKLKVWCSYDGSTVDLNNELSSVIQQFLQNPIPVGHIRSLSVDFEAIPDPDHSLYAFQELFSFCLNKKNHLYLNTLKLHGNMSTLPRFVPKIDDLTELCLSLPRVTENIMAELCKVKNLLYLKVTAVQIDPSIISGDAFKSLRRLRFVVQQENFIPPSIENGALPELVSLQLLCPGLASSAVEIRNLKKLKEIVLDSRVHSDTRRTWEEVARSHPNKPDIFTMK